MNNSTSSNEAKARLLQPWSLFALLISAAGAWLVLSGGPAPIRAIVLFIFLLFVPGWSYIRLLGLRDMLTAWTLAVALSLALGMVVAMLMLYLNAWSPQTGLLILIGVTLIGTLFPTVNPAVEKVQ